MLDTDHLSLHLRGHQQVRERLALLAPDSAAITIVTAEEQLRGRLAQVNKAAKGRHGRLVRPCKAFSSLRAPRQRHDHSPER
jgi:predicted nucleic acid-binding protein